jgi:hypothetical protein
VPAGATVVAESPEAIVTRERPRGAVSGDAVWNGCLRAVGRSVRLTEGSAGEKDASGATAFALGGDHVVFTTEGYDTYSGSTAAVAVVDLRTGHRRAVDAERSDPQEPVATFAEPAVDADGSAAWVRVPPTGGERVLRAAVGRERVEVARGAVSLPRIASGRLTWREGDADRERVFAVPCPARPGEVALARSDDAVVALGPAQRDDDDSTTSTITACRQADGARRTLDAVLSTGRNTVDADRFVLAGTHVAWIRRERDEVDGELSVLLADLAAPARAPRVVALVRSGGGSGFVSVTVDAAGRAAWVRRTSRYRRTLVLRGLDGRARVLDRSRGRALGAVRFDGDRLRWRRDGRERSRSLTPPARP